MNHQLGALQEMHIARVLDNSDPETRGRLRVELQTTGMQLWAACMSAGGGKGYGLSCLPKQDELVIVAFISPEMPIVLGAVWTGENSHPAGAQPVEDKYSLESPEGTRVTLDDANGPRFDVQTRSGHHITITEESSGEIKIERGGESVTLAESGIKINSAATVEVQANQVKVTAGMVQVDAAMSDFSGVVKCNTLIATSVVGTSYTPGAGNVW